MFAEDCGLVTHCAGSALRRFGFSLSIGRAGRKLPWPAPKLCWDIIFPRRAPIQESKLFSSWFTGVNAIMLLVKTPLRNRFEYETQASQKRQHDPLFPRAGAEEQRRNILLEPTSWMKEKLKSILLSKIFARLDENPGSIASAQSTLNHLQLMKTKWGKILRASVMKLYCQQRKPQVKVARRRHPPAREALKMRPAKGVQVFRFWFFSGWAPQGNGPFDPKVVDF